VGLSSFNFLWAPKDVCVLKQSAHWPFKVIQSPMAPIESAYATSYWSSIVTLVTSLVLSCPVSEILQVLYWQERPHSYSTWILGVFHLKEIADVVAPRCKDPKLIIRVINFTTSPTYMPTLGQRYRRTDRRTNGRMTYDSNAALALRASRGKSDWRTSGTTRGSQLLPEVWDSVLARTSEVASPVGRCNIVDFMMNQMLVFTYTGAPCAISDVGVPVWTPVLGETRSRRRFQRWPHRFQRWTQTPLFTSLISVVTRNTFPGTICIRPIAEV